MEGRPTPRFRLHGKCFELEPGRGTRALIRNIGSSTAGLGSGPCTSAVWAFLVNWPRFGQLPSPSRLTSTDPGRGGERAYARRFRLNCRLQELLSILEVSAAQVPVEMAR